MTQLEQWVQKLWNGLYPPADWCGAESAVGVMAQELRQLRASNGGRKREPKNLENNQKSLDSTLK